MHGGSAPPLERRRWFGAALVQAAAVLLGVVAVALTWGWNHWSIGALVAIAAFAIGSDLMSVQSGTSKIKFSGMALGVVLAAALYGPAAAALIGMLTVAVGWFRWREAPHYLRNNLVTFAWFPLASGLFFGAVTRLGHIGHDQPAYYFLVLPAFAITLVVSFAGVVGYQSYLDRASFIPKLREVLVPILSAELFSAVLTAIAVFFVAKTGAIGIVVLLITLAIFQYLVGELLTSQRRAQELHRTATTDDLTGLANRQRFRTAVEEQIAASRASAAPFALMLIDLDRFKEINDTLGHHYGDVILRDLGPRLAACVGDDGIVARLGGDEFAVVPSVRTIDPAALAEVADELIACVSHPVIVDDMTLDVGASIGISRFPIDGEDVHSLLRRADVAMYAAKGEHAAHQLYSAKLDHHSVRRLMVLTDFRKALESDEFVVHYQPIVDIAAARPCGAEGLVRWQHPELGLLAPSHFIPIAEQSGLIGPLTRHVLEHSIAQCAGWHRDGRDLTVAVNLSVRDLLDRELPRQIERMLDEHHLAPDALQLEVTESMLMSDPDRALATVVRLRELGIRVAVDDFGTGYSSLANLRRLPINELKIDRSFISPLLKDESDLIIVRSTINLGHDLGLTVIAEGVEDELTLKRLGMLGCDLAQGYHVSRPLAADAFGDWIGRAGEPSWPPVESAGLLEPGRLEQSEAAAIA
jgi:diguanylate cyclase (GGDEF)-like protein